MPQAEALLVDILTNINLKVTCSEAEQTSGWIKEAANERGKSSLCSATFVPLPSLSLSTTIPRTQLHILGWEKQKTASQLTGKYLKGAFV